jgi:DeoR/GlpR family transcriptional regulator of sugar metabolism
VAFARICEIDAVSELITDLPDDTEAARALTEAGVHVKFV